MSAHSPSPTPAVHPLPVRMRKVKGSGDVELCVAEAGTPDAPAILLVHGFCQSHEAWRRQLEGPLAAGYHLVAPDLRGHGHSGKPEGAYADGRAWAEDLHAVITTLRLERPVLVGWSYGGVVVTDYLRHFGQKNVSGVHFVGALTRLGRPEYFSDFTPEFLQNLPALLSADPEQALRGQDTFVSLLFQQPLTPEERAVVLAYNLAVPLHVRLGVGQRVEDADDVLRGLKVPVSISHGLADKAVQPATSQHIASLVPGSQVSHYADVGHSPFWEDAPRFNLELARFAARCR